MVLGMHLHLSITEHHSLLAAGRDSHGGTVREPPLLGHVRILGVVVADAAVRQTDLRGTVFVTLLGLTAGEGWWLLMFK